MSQDNQSDEGEISVTQYDQLILRRFIVTKVIIDGGTGTSEVVWSYYYHMDLLLLTLIHYDIHNTWFNPHSVLKITGKLLRRGSGLSEPWH